MALVGLEPEHAILGEPLEIGLQRFELKLLPVIKPWGGRAVVIGQDFAYEVAVGERHPVVARLRREARRAGLWQGPQPSDPRELTLDFATYLVELARERGLTPPRPIRLTPKLILATNARLGGETPSLSAEAARLGPLLGAPRGVAPVASAATAPTATRD